MHIYTYETKVPACSTHHMDIQVYSSTVHLFQKCLSAFLLGSNIPFSLHVSCECVAQILNLQRGNPSIPANSL